MRRLFYSASLLSLVVGSPLRAAQESVPSVAVSTKPDEDPDLDGFMNQEEAKVATMPLVEDTDADGVLDGQDAVPNDADFTFPRVPETHYAVIDLGPHHTNNLFLTADSVMLAVNNSGQVLLRTGGIWDKGQVISIPMSLVGKHLSDAREVLGSNASSGGANLIWKPGQATPIELFENSFTQTPPDENGAYTITSIGGNAYYLTSDGLAYEARSQSEQVWIGSASWNTTITSNSYAGSTQLASRDYTSSESYPSGPYIYNDHGVDDKTLSVGSKRLHVVTEYDYDAQYAGSPEMGEDYVTGNVTVALKLDEVVLEQHGFEMNLATGISWENYPSGVWERQVHSINNMATPLYVGSVGGTWEMIPHRAAYDFQGRQATCWIDNGSTGITKILYADYQQTQPLENAYAFKVNARGEILVANESGNFPAGTITYGKLWQNGRVLDLDECTANPTYKYITPGDINNYGLITATATKDEDNDGVFNIGTYSTSTQTYSGPDAEHKILLVPLEINHAAGDSAQIDKPMKYLPQWEPNDGQGKGQPTYNLPPAVFSMSSIGATMQAKILGTTYQLAQNASDPLLYEQATPEISVRLTSAPLVDENAQEFIRATVSMPSTGFANSEYDCAETTANSNSFENLTPGIVATVPALNASAIDTISLTLYESNFTTDFELAETDVDTKVFSGNGLTVKVIGAPSGGVLRMALTSSPRELSNTVEQLTESDGQYRNFDPPTPTSLPKEPVSEFASFYVQVPVNLAQQGQQPKVKLKAKVSGQDTEIAEVALSLAGSNKWRSEKNIVLCSAGSNTSSMTAQDLQDYQVVKMPEGANMDWASGNNKVTVEYAGGTVDVPAQASGVVLQSLPWFDSRSPVFGIGAGNPVMGLDPETRIRQPFQKMGYTMYRDYSAKKVKTIADYAPNKQIWYSMSHGSTADGLPSSEFEALEFIDGHITKDDLSALHLNYRLAIVDGCVSAQTSTLSEEDARSTNTLLEGPAAFAQCFGPNSAYIGWGWEMGPNGAQTWSGQFVAELKGGKTVEQAHDAFLAKMLPTAAAASLMKLYGRGDAIIDMKAKPNAIFADSH